MNVLFAVIQNGAMPDVTVGNCGSVINRADGTWSSGVRHFDMCRAGQYAAAALDPAAALSDEDGHAEPIAEGGGWPIAYRL